MLTEDLLEQIDLSSGVSVLGTPGLVGNQTQVQLDVSRLPRLEEYVAMLDANTADIDDIPSDIKTVAYFVQSPDTLGGVEDALATATAELGLDTDLSNGGLVRRSLDESRPWKQQTRKPFLLNQTGIYWHPKWRALNSPIGMCDGRSSGEDEYEELPLAISVTLTLQSENSPATDGVGSGEMRVFTHIVRLPLANPIDQTEEDELSEQDYELIQLRNPTQSHQCGDIRKRRAANQSGFVLVLVLIVIVVATMAVYSFTDLMVAYDDAAYLSGDLVQARVTVESAAEAMRLVLAQPPDLRRDRVFSTTRNCFKR